MMSQKPRDILYLITLRKEVGIRHHEFRKLFVSIGLFFFFASALSNPAMSGDWQELNWIDDVCLVQQMKVEPRGDCEDVKLSFTNNRRYEHGVRLSIEEHYFVCHDGGEEKQSDTNVIMSRDEMHRQSYTGVCCGKGGMASLRGAILFRQHTPTGAIPDSSLGPLLKCIAEQNECNRLNKSGCEEAYQKCLC
jgi:hypothetical protein